MKALRSLLIASLLAAASTAVAQDANPWKFEFHGFVTGSMFIQDQVFAGGSGQDNLLFAPTQANAAPCKTAACVGGTYAAGQARKSDTFLGADVRQSRWIFSMTGPQAFGATPKAYFEGDFYGASAGGGIEHTQARLRAAFGELKWGNTQLQIGQYSAQLVLAQLSASVAHIANPITFGTGTIGGRAQGVRVIHAVPLGDNKLELAGEVLASKLSGEARPTAAGEVSRAWASNTPSLGGRATFSGKAGDVSYSVYGAGIYEQVNLKGFGNSASPTGVTLVDGKVKTGFSPYAVEAGGRVAVSIVNLAGNYYTGTGTGIWAGSLNQQGEIDGSGYWVQLGVTPHKLVGIYALYGGGSASKTQAANWVAVTGFGGDRKDNTMYGGILRVSDGGYTFAAEYYNIETTRFTATANTKTSGYQAIVSGHYAF